MASMTTGKKNHYCSLLTQSQLQLDFEKQPYKTTYQITLSLSHIYSIHKYRVKNLKFRTPHYLQSSKQSYHWRIEGAENRKGTRSALIWGDFTGCDERNEFYWTRSPFHISQAFCPGRRSHQPKECEDSSY